MCAIKSCLCSADVADESESGESPVFLRVACLYSHMAERTNGWRHGNCLLTGQICRTWDATLVLSLVMTLQTRCQGEWLALSAWNGLDRPIHGGGGGGGGKSALNGSNIVGGK